MKEIEFNQVVTRGGDRGESSLYDGRRYVKSSAYFDSLGDVDELSSFIGLAKTAGAPNKIMAALTLIQETLLRLGAQIATEPSSSFYKQIKPIETKDIEALEKEISRLMNKTDIKPVFVLPGEPGRELSARADVCRSVARRAERSLVNLIREHGKPELSICQNYLNRLSDYFFVLARHTA